MDINGIVEGIDQEIARLKQARDLLAGETTGKRRGRPVGSGATKGNKVAKRAGKGLSAEGRAKIAKAMRERWAKKRAAGTKKVA